MNGNVNIDRLASDPLPGLTAPVTFSSAMGMDNSSNVWFIATDGRKTTLFREDISGNVTALLSTGEARKRLNAIKQYTSLGAGFKIALRDLEIRGAGNILGTQQSGHICAIGFELYCSLLKQAMAKHKGQWQEVPEQAALHLDFVAEREPDFLRRRHLPRRIRLRGIAAYRAGHP